MSNRLQATLRSVIRPLKRRIVDWLLGPIARASRLVADADARLVGFAPAGRASVGRSVDALL